MSLSALPVELLDAIFEPLHHQTLVALVTTCSYLTHSASRHLYRSLSLSSHSRNLSAVCTLAKRPHLATFVRSFSINLDDSNEVFQKYYLMLGKALHNMQDLTSLELQIGSQASWILSKAIHDDNGIIYSRLEHLATSLPFDSSLSSFLTRTPSLRSFQLSSLSHSDDAELPSSAIPHLCSYTGPSSLLQVLCSRPLHSLHLSGDFTLQHVELLAQLSSAPSPSVISTAGEQEGCVVGPAKVEVLSAITSSPPVLVLEALAKACPRLAYLRMMTTCAFWEAPDLTFYASIANTLSSLRSLSAFELSGMHWESRPKHPTSSCDNVMFEKEWVSPPVTPRVVDMDFEEHEERDFGFEEAFLEWAY